jgi:hypothetical protein
MIAAEPAGLVLCRPVARALLEFAAPEALGKPELSIGIHAGRVCAAGPHAFARFLDIELSKPNGLYWPREYVEALYKDRKASSLVLGWNDAVQGFPNLSEVDVRAEFDKGIEALCFDPEIFARMQWVCKACRRKREEGERPDQVPIPRVKMVGAGKQPARGKMRPFVFEVTNYGNNQHDAQMVVMPVQM